MQAFKQKLFRILHCLTFETLKRYFSFVTNPILRYTKERRLTHHEPDVRNNNLYQSVVFMEIKVSNYLSNGRFYHWRREVSQHRPQFLVHISWWCQTDLPIRGFCDFEFLSRTHSVVQLSCLTADCIHIKSAEETATPSASPEKSAVAFYYFVINLFP